MMDAEAFAYSRNSQLKTFATCFTRVGYDATQAKLIESCIREDSSPPFLAAIILSLPTASQLAMAAACDNESTQAVLLEYARQTASSNRTQASLLSDQPALAPTDAKILSLIIRRG
jgi:hypothetical protein